MRQTGWYWMPRNDAPHYVKDVTLCFYNDATQQQSYNAFGPAIMDNFGQLVSGGVR